MLKIDNRSQNTRVSVVIPAYNEEAVISNTISDILNQRFDEPVELLVINNNSTDKTAQIAEELGAKVVLETEKGTRFAYDRAFREATGDIVVMINADVRVDSDWLQTIVSKYDDPGVVGVGTHIRFIGAPAYVNWFWWLNHMIAKVLSKLGFNDGIITFWGASMSSTKEVFEKVGGFNHGTNTNEDMVYTKLINKHGKTIYTYDTVAKLDGRRYAGNPITAFKNWIGGIGANSLFVGAGMGSKIKDFKDVREPTT